MIICSIKMAQNREKSHHHQPAQSVVAARGAGRAAAKNTSLFLSFRSVCPERLGKLIVLGIKIGAKEAFLAPVCAVGLCVCHDRDCLQRVTPCEKRHSFFEFSLCFSRACLGKTMHFIYKRCKKWRVSYLASAAPPGVCVRAQKSTGGFVLWSFPYVCPEPVLVKSSFLYINGSKRPFLV
jgi:hypothetical protein|eukprot:COSAG06_NODE_18771_length_869_cov_67.779221_1_plen_180_part_00